ncbi:MAG: sortase [Anaerolineae bacterium]|nr:sortase [Anaerolineae bacterium]
MIVLTASTALITYLALIVPGQVRASQGPPEALVAAATQAALAQPPAAADAAAQLAAATAAAQITEPTPTLAATPLPEQLTPTANPHGDWPLAANADVDYWLSIPAIGLEAPIIGLATRERVEEGVTVQRLLVPNSFSVGWDVRSAEPGLAGNTVLVGHNNLYGGVFANLKELTYGSEIAVWSPAGVFSYYVSQIEYILEEDQSLDVRMANTHWLGATGDNRVTLITCWPDDHSSHRLIVIGQR